MQKIILRLILLCLIALAVLFPQITLKGAGTGLNLWLFTLVPTLLPFLIFTNILIAIQGDLWLSRLLYCPLKKLFPVSFSGTYAICIGMLCGYPMGAKAVADLLNDRKISLQEGQYLLCFCNYPSPMFLAGYVCQVCGLQEYSWILFTALYGSLLFSGQLFRLFTPAGHGQRQCDSVSAVSAISDVPAERFRFSMLDNAILQAIRTILKFGGYVMLYSILAAYIRSIGVPWIFPKLLTEGILEITNGISDIALQGLSVSLMLPVVCFLSAFGGLSTFSQTASVLSGSKISLGRYFFAKLTNGILAFAIAVLLLQLL